MAWICTMHEIPSVSLHLRIGKNGFLFSNGFIGVIAYGFLPGLLIAILIAHFSLNH
nr:MAG TPA: Tetrahydromethanopterin S-methyltransferase subunit B [Bacteriophage sp.]DAT87001.1 MAG TPA: Tetrahydromethanopterin S-methyltransferase subunit B [Caudoviricetes sp.]